MMLHLVLQDRYNPVTPPLRCLESRRTSDVQAVDIVTLKVPQDLF